jgi:hypothetical protein
MPLAQRKHEAQHLAAKLGANSLSAIAMRDYARLYNGELHTFSKPNVFRMTSLLHDVSQRMQEPRAAAPAASPELYIR